MQKNGQDDNGDNDDGSTNNLVKFTGIAFQMVIIIAVFTYGGYKIDALLNHQVKWATAVLALTGVLIALYVVFKSLKS